MTQTREKLDLALAEALEPLDTINEFKHDCWQFVDHFGWRPRDMCEPAMTVMLIKWLLKRYVEGEARALVEAELLFIAIRDHRVDLASGDLGLAVALAVYRACSKQVIAFPLADYTDAVETSCEIADQPSRDKVIETWNAIVAGIRTR